MGIKGYQLQLGGMEKKNREMSRSGVTGGEMKDYIAGYGVTQ
jgi:hypothetical protein